MEAWNFVFLTDFHMGTPRSYRFRPAINANWKVARRQILDARPDLLLVGGDMTRDGMNHRFELEQSRNELERLPFPWRAIPGNHDVGNKYHPDAHLPICRKYVRLYRSVFGPDCWSFRHRNVQFTGINAFLAGSGLPEEAEMWEWLDRQERFPEVDYHVWIMHPAIFLLTPDEPNVDIHENQKLWYLSVDNPHRTRILEALLRTKADLLLTGHLHCRREYEWEGIRIVSSPSTAWGSSISVWPDGDSTQGFLNCFVRESGIETVLVPLEETSTLTGYGPGGNPPMETRDYSAAWEQPPLDPVEQGVPAADALASRAGCSTAASEE